MLADKSIPWGPGKYSIFTAHISIFIKAATDTWNYIGSVFFREEPPSETHTVHPSQQNSSCLNLSAVTALVHYMPCLTLKYQPSILAANPGAGTRRWNTPGPAHPKIRQRRTDGFPCWHPLPRGSMVENSFPVVENGYLSTEDGLVWGDLLWQNPELPSHHGEGEKFLVDVALGRVPGVCPQLGSSSSSSSSSRWGQNKHRNWEAPKGSFFGAKSWLGTALGGRGAFPALWFLEGSGVSMASHGRSGTHRPRPRFQGGIPLPTSQTGRERRAVEGKQEVLSTEFWRAASAKKKKKNRVRKALWLQQKPLLAPRASSGPGEVFARPVLRGFGVVQLTHLGEQCLGRSWASFSHSGWYGGIQGILCVSALVS